ncbi:methyl-accepting chemotaxis protein [Aliarcobacter cryaerophilus]|uniref:Methyl-accepting chemotaxis protein n=2 Tax=unclassified Arcobacter TaxID=2593671 RepID=A0AA96D1I0_9BACT|nr:methyl-accepting chemotaxis protein [Arcobacter sp. AZ-2023]WPD09316.1 methyl-accepting chemotaxis protein [Arcobacter sp. DSM 115954]WNL14147.1 methyl-accepting chemotaxis protein [Arcobacter sp. AZ-2023]WNL19971.1 methyl-accepting chemotaxis protein [Arcobacter sp. AZ-2023]WNL22112.1 methyl-accepting chemotaxis protein [Arcobacter sp. AZ-2023]
MLKSLDTRKKLYFFPILFIIIAALSTIIYLYFIDIAHKRNAAALTSEKFVLDIAKTRISVYQFLRTATPNNENIVIENIQFLKNSLAESSKSFVDVKNKELASKTLSLIDRYVELFKVYSKNKIEDYNNNILEESDTLKQNIAAMVKIGLEMEENIHKINESAVKLRDEAYANLDRNLMIILTIATILFIGISVLVANNIINSVNSFKDGLLGFFAYLNREASDTTLLDESNKDEFGQMAKVVNVNILKTKAGIEEDRRLIDETISVLGEFEQGDLCQRLNTKVSNPALMQLSTVINGMGDVLEKNIENILDVLEKYSSYNYLSKVSTNGLKEQLLALANGVNGLGDSITSMLKDNKSNGLTLDESSMILLANVDKLNISSNEAAASLEETAAALEEITSNIRNNTESIAKMSMLSNGVTKAVNEGQAMANQTTTAMDEINVQVNLVNEAIGVIDNIAFQTNILSLNAAVEAATAGEAGKGFAVVAQEVRNLATRSAEAAKEIKAIVERATIKANEGKNIATNMIDGYKNLNSNISSTMNLISDIENASKEQLLGIEQINDAVNQLDQQTQQNAMIASQSHDIALSTDEIAKLIVQDANQKEFEGKNEVKAKNAGIKKEVKEHIIASTPKKIIKTSKPNINSTKEITSSSSNDEWGSF